MELKELADLDRSSVTQTQFGQTQVSYVSAMLTYVAYFISSADSYFYAQS